MPELPLGFDPDQPIRPPVADFSDMLFDVRKPVSKEAEELTPEQARARGFHEAAGTGRPGYASKPGPRYSISSGEVCRFGGSPPRHTQVGKHCPHGMLELLAEMDHGVPDQEQ